MVNIGSGKGLLPVPCQAIKWTSVNLLPIGPIITNFRKVLIKLLQFSFKKYIWICRLQNVIHFVQFSVCEAEVISLTHWGRVTHICISKLTIILPPASTKLKGGYTGITLSVCPSVRLWTESCPLCIFNNTHRIHFIFAHLIKQLQKVCHV